MAKPIVIAFFGSIVNALGNNRALGSSAFLGTPSDPTDCGLSSKATPPKNEGLLMNWLPDGQSAPTKSRSTIRFSIILGLVAVTVSALCTAPFKPPFDWEVEISHAMEWKTQHPLTPLPDRFTKQRPNDPMDGAYSHNEKIDPRVTLPILGYLLRTGRLTVAIWNTLSCIAVFALLAALALKTLGDTVSAALFVLSLAPTNFAWWFLRDHVYGDGTAHALALTAVLVRPRWLACTLLACAAFVDERCLATLPLLLLLAYLLGRPAYRALLWGAVLWGAGRIILAWPFHLVTGSDGVMAHYIVVRNLSRFPDMFVVFLAAWLLPALAIFNWFTKGQKKLALMLSAAIACAAGPAFLIFDLLRSLTYCFSALLISLHGIRDVRSTRLVLGSICAANFIWLAFRHGVSRQLF